MEERFAVTTATGTLGPVLVKLTALLGDAQYRLQEGTRQDMASIKSGLEPVNDLLGKLCGREDLDVACKDWMAEARELSYDLEDSIDRFGLGLDRGGLRRGFMSYDLEDSIDSFDLGLDRGGLRRGFIFQRIDMHSPFKEFVERVKDVSKRGGKMPKIGDAILCNRSKLTTDPRALFLHKDASELVGMEEKKKELIELLQNHTMVCNVGPGGMGKTTLADLVYHAVGDEFQCRAFVSVHPSPNMMEIMGTILTQVKDGAVSAGSGTEPAAQQNMINDMSATEPAAEQNGFIKAISTFLSDKRKNGPGQLPCSLEDLYKGVRRETTNSLPILIAVPHVLAFYFLGKAPVLKRRGAARQVVKSLLTRNSSRESAKTTIAGLLAVCRVKDNEWKINYYQEDLYEKDEEQASTDQVVQLSHAAAAPLTSEEFWHTALLDTPLPDALRWYLHHGRPEPTLPLPTRKKSHTWDAATRRRGLHPVLDAGGRRSPASSLARDRRCRHRRPSTSSRHGDTEHVRGAASRCQ